MFDADIAKALVGLCCFKPYPRIFLHRSSVSIFRGVEVSYLFVAKAQPLSQVARIERWVSVRHKEVDLDRISNISIIAILFDIGSLMLSQPK